MNLYFVWINYFIVDSEGFTGSGMKEFSHLVSSNKICEEFISSNSNCLPIFGKLTVGLMGIIAGFISYKELIFKIRYVNKNWLLFTQKYSSYVSYDPSKSKPSLPYKTACIKTLVDKLYRGEVIVPIIWHPFYSEAEDLSIFYEYINKPDSLVFELHQESEDLTFYELHQKYIDLFFIDLFKFYCSFKCVKKLRLIRTYSIDTQSDEQYTQFEHLFSSKSLVGIEELILDQKYLTLDNQVFKLLDKVNFPSLKYVDLPRINKKLDCLLNYKREDGLKEFPEFKIENYFTSDFGPKILNIRKCDYEGEFNKLKEFASDQNHPIYRIEKII